MNEAQETGARAPHPTELPRSRNVMQQFFRRKKYSAEELARWDRYFTAALTGIHVPSMPTHQQLAEIAIAAADLADIGIVQYEAREQ